MARLTSARVSAPGAAAGTAAGAWGWAKAMDAVRTAIPIPMQALVIMDSS